MAFYRWRSYAYIYEIDEKYNITKGGVFKGMCYVQKCKICGKMHLFKVHSNDY